MGISGYLNVNSTAVFSGPVTFAGSVGFTGLGRVTLSKPMVVNTPMLVAAGSAANQFHGFSAIASGAGSVVISTTAVKSNSLIYLTPILTGPIEAMQGSGFILGPLCVSSISEGKTFTISWMGTPLSYAGPQVNVAWKIELQA